MSTASGIAPSRLPTVTMDCVRVIAATSSTSACMPSSLSSASQRAAAVIEGILEASLQPRNCISTKLAV